MIQFSLLRCLSEPASAMGLIYLSHKGDIFRLDVLERVCSKAGRAVDDPDSGSVGETHKTHQLTSCH